ncbi:cation diffusion facilitator family transporter [Sabulicella glaciei]|uniref:Cation diffusion facilitator family transporter n=1 Tax=Sabulicella glaciei TaxID=2984948 RepID=A0ABT3NVH6_9PROT|nr:cation diffusion facilitator family transporter [Roseococcus sp. MDT2-1-1]
MSRAVNTAWGSVAVAIAVLALKAVAWWLTGSVALFADALESVVNVAAALAALAAVRYAALPADANHPYGHHKAEYFSAVLEGALILAAAFVILVEVWSSFSSPRIPDLTWPAAAVALAATAINALWCRHLFRRSAALRSPALKADARHLLSDVVTSVGVLAGIGLAAATGLWWLDPLLAGLTALNILASGAGLVRESVGGLMDEAVAPESLARIRAIVGQAAEGAIEAHDIRSRQAGRLAFIEFHLVVPGTMTVDEAHVITDRVEAALKAELGEAVITIHVEPEGKAKHSGVVVL